MDDSWRQALDSIGTVEILKCSKIKLSIDLDRANAAPDALCRPCSVRRLTAIVSSMPNVKQSCEPLKERKNITSLK